MHIWPECFQVRVTILSSHDGSHPNNTVCNNATTETTMFLGAIFLPAEGRSIRYNVLFIVLYANCLPHLHMHLSLLSKLNHCTVCRRKHTHTHTYTHTHTQTCTHSIYIHTFTYTNTHTYTQICEISVTGLV